MERWRRNRRTLLLSPLALLLMRPFVRTALALADGIQTPPCFVLLSKAQGQYPHNRPDLWIPQSSAGGLTLPAALAPFEPVKSSLNFLCGYDNVAMRTQIKTADGKTDEVDWHHASATLFTGGLLAYSEKTGDDNIAPASTQSLDWYVASKWNTTPLHITPTFREGDPPRKNGDRISWRLQPDGTISYFQETLNALQAWNQVFKGLTAPGSQPTADQLAANQRQALNKSILDGTIADTNALNQVLSQQQRQALDAHQTALRELELRLNSAPVGPAAGCVIPGQPPQPPDSNMLQSDVLQRITDAQDLLLAVMRCGLRPILGFHLAHMSGSEMVPGLWTNGDQYIPTALKATPSATGYHNDLWHRAGEDPGNDLWMVRLEAKIAEFYAKILTGMQDIPSGASNLLDQSIVLYGSIQTYDHSSLNHSFIMAGSNGGKIKTGRVLKTNDFSSRTGGSANPHNAVLVSTLNALGFGDVTQFGTPSLSNGGVQGFL